MPIMSFVEMYGKLKEEREERRGDSLRAEKACKGGKVKQLEVRIYGQE